MNSPRYPEFSILMVDDEAPWLRAMGMILEGPGGMNNLSPCQDSRQVLPLLDQGNFGVVILDLTMPHLSGEELLERITEEHPEICVIILSGLNQLETAVRCMRKGAFDYLVKTDEDSRILDCVRRAVRMQELERENQALRRHYQSEGLRNPEAFSDFITQSRSLRNALQYLEAVAPTSQPVLITGESGTGKEIAARCLHRISRGEQPLVALNVAGLDDNMFSDTLFGHLRGAFSGADTPRRGLIEEAGEGTLFLDEIGDLSPASQVKLLRLLQEGEYYPLGSDKPKPLRARIVVATHAKLQQKMAEGSFRKDLFYRLRTHQAHLPPLRERKEDIPPLLEHLLEKAAATLGKNLPPLPRELPALLASYHFPGNVRELEAMIFDALSLHGSGTLSLACFRSAIRTQAEVPSTPQENPFAMMDQLPSLAEAAELLVEEAMKRSGGNQSTAATLLGVSQPALSKRLKKSAPLPL